MPARVVSVLVLVVSLLLGACGRPHGGGAAAGRALTFNTDIAPILYEHCGSCHRPAKTQPGSVDAAGDPVCIAGAPFALLEYSDVRAHARQIVAATRSRLMPPWLPEHGDGDFLNERRLTDDQIQVLDRWAAAGAAEGDPAERPPIPTWPDGWQLGKPDLVVNLSDSYTLRPGSADVFRNFVFPMPLSSTKYVRGIEFRTDNPRAVHHASVAIDRARISRRADRSDGETGFAVMPDEEVQNVFGWSPGKAPLMEPADRAWTLDKGSDLVVQMHMLPSDKPEPIQPSIGLFFTDTPPSHSPIVITLQSKTIDIPADARDYVIEDRYVLPADVEVVSIYPHAHYLAKDMRGYATLPDGTTKWLLRIKRWDFRWQDKYVYRSPVSLPKGTTLAMRFTYDNSHDNPRNQGRSPQRVSWGPRSSDEMAALWLEVLPRQPADVDVLTTDSVRRSMQADVAAAEMQARTNPADPGARNFLAARFLQAGRVAEAVTQLEEALRLNVDDAEAHSNLAKAFQLEGRLGEAIREAREAERLKPHDDRVRFNLGYILQATGQNEPALNEYRRAIEINPKNQDAHFNMGLILGSRGQLAEAVTLFRRALAINPQKADIHRNLGLALDLQGRSEEAIEEFREALRIQPNLSQAQGNLDEALSTLGRKRLH